MKLLSSLSLRLVVIALLSLVGGAAFAQQSYQAVAVKKGTFNWVRVAPRPDANILEEIKQGTALTVVDKSGAYFAVILPDGVHGWLHESNVRMLPAVVSEATTAQQASRAVAVKKGTFNWVRVAPDSHSHILEKIPQGTAFTVVGKAGAYYAVVLSDGVHGWLHESNVRFQ